MTISKDGNTILNKNTIEIDTENIGFGNSGEI
jgi:hypothetical protein